MLRSLTIACAGLALMTATAGAQVVHINQNAQDPPLYTYQSSKSEVEFFATNFGIFGQSPAGGAPGLVYPYGSGQGYMFGSGLWFGAQKNVAGEIKKLTFVTYNPISGISWASPGELVSAPDAAIPALFTSANHSLIDGLPIPGGPYHPTWPLWLPSGVRATPMMPGIFEPVDSARVQGASYSRPAFVEGVSEQFVARFNDGDLKLYEVVGPVEQMGFPLGLQIQETIYSWLTGPYTPAVMIQYQIVNRSVDTLFNCVASQVSDPDIGIQDNDYLRYYSERPELRAAYAWTTHEGTGHGALAMSLIEAPVTDSLGFVNSSARRAYKEQGRIGSFPDWTEDNDPKGSAERYDFMASGTFANSLSPTDKRSLMASTPFSMRPGDTAYFTVAYIILDSVPEQGEARRRSTGRKLVRGGANMENFETTLTMLLNDYYDNGTFSSIVSSASAGSEPETALALAAIPNPVNDRATIRLTLAAPADGTLRITDNLGQTVLTRKLGHRPAGTYDEAIDARSLPTGLYFAIVESGGRTGIARFTVSR